MKTHVYAPALIFCSCFAAAVAGAEETQQQLESEAKITELAARAVVLARVPNGVIRNAELERENGKLVWSYDINTPRSKNVTEVQIDAITGKIVSVNVETPQDEAKEAAADKKGRSSGNL